MTINKFGRYLSKSNTNTSSKFNTSNPPKVYKNTVDFENKLLRNVRNGQLKNDVITKGQLEEAVNFCLLKIKKNSQALDVLKEDQNHKKSSMLVSGVENKPKETAAVPKVKATSTTTTVPKKKSLKLLS